MLPDYKPFNDFMRGLIALISNFTPLDLSLGDEEAIGGGNCSIRLG